MTEHRRAPGAIDRLPGEKWSEFSARQRAAQLAEMPAPKFKRCRQRRDYRRAQQRIADRIDGFDRDDIGLSPDW